NGCRYRTEVLCSKNGWMANDGGDAGTTDLAGRGSSFRPGIGFGGDTATHPAGGLDRHRSAVVPGNGAVASTHRTAARAPTTRGGLTSSGARLSHTSNTFPSAATRRVQFG